MVKIGVDLDGVIAVPTIERVSYQMNEFYSSCVPQLMFPDEANIIIVTGRKITFKDVTVQWLIENRIKYSKIFFNPNVGNRKSKPLLIEHKAGIIKEEGISLFIEDDHIIAFKIKSLIPKCEILLYFNNKFYSINLLNSKTFSEMINNGVKIITRPKTAIKRVELEPEMEILISYNDNYYTINPVNYNA